MATKSVEFWYVTGLLDPIFRHARLVGSWDASGRYSNQWTESAMEETTWHDGLQAFRATVELDRSVADQVFRWGVVLDGPQGTSFWGVPTEVADASSTERNRSFRLRADDGPQTETYFFTYKRRLGAQKHFRTPDDNDPSVRFSVWAPNAQRVEVVFGRPENGYIYDDGRGIDTARPPIPLTRTTGGIWEAVAPSFASFVDRSPYMYRLVNAQGNTVYRTDIFARSQAGGGGKNPKNDPTWDGTPETLDGSKSCSLVVDPDRIELELEPPVNGRFKTQTPSDFWATELDRLHPLPTRVQDLVIYELHVGALGFSTSPKGGTLEDAIGFLDHLEELGVNAVELLPMSEASGDVSWGYGDTHHFCIETLAGGYDKYKHFVRECHRRGIAVIQDVVYNHYDPNALRAQWQYDSEAPEQNIYYWYEGLPSQYRIPTGGYLDNESSGWAPRYWEEVVRHQFISSAAFLVDEMHVDGIRVDLTQALHRDNRLHEDGRYVPSANQFGQKLLRELSRTLHMIRPTLMLIAEDHTGWDAVTKPAAAGGLGFDATWFAGSCHSLVGDSESAEGFARLLKIAGYGHDGPLPLDAFAGVLQQTGSRKVVYHKNHDECGNASGSARTVVTAVNRAPLIGPTRTMAEARARVGFGLALFSAGTPLFFMGEEIASQRPFVYNDVLNGRDDFATERVGYGAPMFRFYQDAITLSRRLPSVRSHNLDVLHVHNDNRVIAFKRWDNGEEVIVVASLSNRPFDGYVLRKDALAIPSARWKEVFNSDADRYGGANLGNFGSSIQASDGALSVRIPASGLLVLVRQQ